MPDPLSHPTFHFRLPTYCIRFRDIPTCLCLAFQYLSHTCSPSNFTSSLQILAQILLRNNTRCFLAKVQSLFPLAILVPAPTAIRPYRALQPVVDDGGLKVPLPWRMVRKT